MFPWTPKCHWLEMSDVLDILIGTNPKMTSSDRMTFLLGGSHYYSCVSVRFWFLPEKMHTLQYNIKKKLTTITRKWVEWEKDKLCYHCWIFKWILVTIKEKHCNCLDEQMQLFVIVTISGKWLQLLAINHCNHWWLKPLVINHCDFCLTNVTVGINGCNSSLTIVTIGANHCNP